MSIPSLSTGILQQIMTGNEVKQPVLQILGTKKIVSGGDNERYRVLISDGKFLNSFAMLATQLNSLQQEDKLKEFTIIRVDRYSTSIVNKTDKADKWVMIILELTVLKDGNEVGHKIGNPKAFNLSDASSVSATPTPAPNTNNNYGRSNAASMNQTINSEHLISPIISLSPYNNKWVIKVRCMSKSSIRTWNNAKGEGKLFSMDLCDRSGEIRATAFRDDVDKYYELIKPDSVYLISKCQLKAANKQFNNLKNDYEMTFGPDTIVQLCEDETDDSIPTVQYNFIPISRIAEMEDKSIADICGVVKDVGEIINITSRTTNKEFKKRELIVVDQSNSSIALQIWNDDAVNFDGHIQPVIAVKGAKVSEFNGSKNLSIGGGAIMKINPDIPECHQVRGWFDNGGADNITNFISARVGGSGGSMSTDWLSFFDVRTKNLGSGDKPDYFQTKATIQMVRGQNAIYKACSEPQCNKKVVEEGNGLYHCEKCCKTSHNYNARFLVNMSVSDWTSNRWVTCFNELVEQIMGKTASEVEVELQDAYDGHEGGANEVFAKLCFKTYVFKLRCKVETYGDTQRNKFSVVSASPVNYKEYNRYLIGDLSRITGISKN